MKTGYLIIMGISAILLVPPAFADSVFFSTNDPDGKIGMASRPSSPGKVENEAADDFILSSETDITGASFTGLLSGTAPSVGEVVVEIYRVFSKDSDTLRTINVPTRANSPSDIAFDSRDTATPNLNFTSTVLNPNFAAANSVLNGINPKPLQTTGGEGQISGQEVRFDVTFTTPFDLPADHYFFVPQMEVNNGEFFWLSAPKPIVSPGTPFAPDLQAWTRNEPLQPDWLRVGSDIVGPDPATAPTFNASFSLTGAPVPEPSSLALLACAGVPALLLARRRRCLNKRTTGVQE
jgi:hypothetical protein